jgi:hypothetical protein
MRPAIIAFTALAACGTTATSPTGAIRYDGIETRLLTVI